MHSGQGWIYDNAAEFKATTPTFAHYLRNLGYQTALCGKMHFVGPDQLHGFEERLTTDIYPTCFGWTPNWEKPLERVDWWYHNLNSVTGAGVAQISNQLEYDDDVSYHAKLKLYQHSRRLYDAVYYSNFDISGEDIRTARHAYNEAFTVSIVLRVQSLPLSCSGEAI